MNDYKKNLLKIPKFKREMSSTTAKLKDFEKMLSKTMQLWHDDSFKLIKNDEDKRFLENMMTSRTATYATADKVTQTKEAKKRRRGEHFHSRVYNRTSVHTALSLRQTNQKTPDVHDS